MGLGKAGHKFKGIFIFTAVKNPFPGDKNVLKDDHGGLPLAKNRISKLFKIICLIPLR
jgi:hypothetical protein